MDLNSYVDLIKAQFKIKFLALHVDSRFSSLLADARPQIRQDIVANYSSLLSSSEKRVILNLEALPFAQNLFFSISHNKSVGGYATCDQIIGFDLEEISRLSIDTISRVCTSSEMAACPDFRLLWSAKEAAFKTSKQLLVMADIEITSWMQVDDISYFEATCRKASLKIKGAVFLSNHNTVSCCFID